MSAADSGLSHHALGLLKALDDYTKAEDKLEDLTVRAAASRHEIEEALGADAVVVALPTWKTSEDGTNVDISKKNYRRLKKEADLLGITPSKHLTNILTRAMKEHDLEKGLAGETVTMALNRNLDRILRGEL